jgi:predicted ATPase
VDFYLMRPQQQTAHELGEQLLILAQQVPDAAPLLEAHVALGITAFLLGETVPARAHLDQGITLYDPLQHDSHAVLYGEDPGVLCLVFSALVLWVLGYPDQAVERSHQTLTLAQKLAHPHSLALALGFAAWLHQFRREAEVVYGYTEAAATLSTEQGFALWSANGMLLQGWVLVEQGQEEAGLLQMQQGIAAWRVTGAEVLVPYFLALQAEMYGMLKQPDMGLTLLAEALATSSRTGECFCEAELHRLKGELLLQHVIPDIAQAEACFQRALGIARQQQAKSWELRAAISVSRLWQQQGKLDVARQLLAEVYGWFTEGFDTADLKKAKALLKELG